MTRSSRSPAGFAMVGVLGLLVVVLLVSGALFLGMAREVGISGDLDRESRARAAAGNFAREAARRLAAGRREEGRVEGDFENRSSPVLSSVGSRIDVNGDANQTARMIRALVGFVQDPRGRPIGSNGLGIEVATLPDAEEILVRRVASFGARFGSVEEFFGSLPVPEERWEVERLRPFLVADCIPPTPRPVDVNQAPREVLAAAYSVHLAVELGGKSPEELAAATLERRNQAPFQGAEDFSTFLASVGVPADELPLAVFATGPATTHLVHLDLVGLQESSVSQDVYPEGAGSAGGTRAAYPGSHPFEARIAPVPLRLSDFPSAQPVLLEDPYSLELRGGRPILFDDSEADGWNSFEREVQIESGVVTLALEFWLPGEVPEDGDVQDLAIWRGEAWRVLGSGGVERMSGSIGVPASIGLEAGTPILQLVAAEDSLRALDARGRILEWREAFECWREISPPGLEEGDRVTSIALRRLEAGSDWLAGTRAGRVFLLSGSGWSDLGEIPGSPRILALYGTADLVLAGTHQAGIHRLVGTEWVMDGALFEGKSVGTFAPLEGGEVLAGTSAGVFRRGSDAGWTPDGLEGIPISDLWTDGEGALAGTIGRGLHERTVGGAWRRVAEAPADANVRAVGRGFWGLARDGGVSVAVILEDGSGNEVGRIPPELVPGAGTGRRYREWTTELVGVARKARFLVARFERSGSAPELLEVSLGSSRELGVVGLALGARPESTEPPPGWDEVRRER